MTTPAHEPPRILLLFTEVFANGGIQRFNRTFLAALTELKVQCDVLSMQDTPQSIGRRTPQPNVEIMGFLGNRRKFAAATVHAIWRRRYNWVLIGHINLLSMTMAALATNPSARASTLLIAHGIEVWYRISRSRRHALARVSNILCVSEYTRSRILEQVPSLQPERLRIFPNALGEAWATVKQAPPSHQLPQHFILSVTRLQKGDRYKGVVTVIEALSMLQDMSLQYVVVGHGDDLPFLQRVALRFGVQHRVRFLGGVSDHELINLYEQCQAFVLPSGKEGFGIVFLEAMFFGAPVIAAAEKGALDVVRDGETGLLVRFGDSVALMRAIERLSSEKALRAQLRQGGRATVVGVGAFTFLRFVERAAEILEIPRTRVA
jgi:glycosyltransferase involved in cell wall biosynthesis